MLERDEPSQPARYPTHWEADVVAADGGTLHLRPITPEDADAIVDASNSRNPLDLKPFTIGARNVVAAAERAGVGRAVLLSILGV